MLENDNSYELMGRGKLKENNRQSLNFMKI
jgi:hypothetical protein